MYVSCPQVYLPHALTLALHLRLCDECQHTCIVYYHMPNILDNSIPIENVHCLIYFLLG